MTYMNEFPMDALGKSEMKSNLDAVQYQGLLYKLAWLVEKI